MKRNLQTIIFVLWIILIFVLTGYPGIAAPKVKEFPIDKVYHFLIFFVLGILGYRILKTGHLFLLGIVVIVTAEFQQIFIPGRDFEILDMVAGFVGLSVSFFMLKYIVSKRLYVSKT